MAEMQGARAPKRKKKKGHPVLLVLLILLLAVAAAGVVMLLSVRKDINGGEKIEFLIPNSLENLPLILNEFEDADSGEITPRVSAGQGKKIRIKPVQWGKDITEIKKLLPQYVIARKYQGLTGENEEMYQHKLAEWNILKG